HEIEKEDGDDDNRSKKKQKKDNNTVTKIKEEKKEITPKVKIEKTDDDEEDEDDENEEQEDDYVEEGEDEEDDQDEEDGVDLFSKEKKYVPPSVDDDDEEDEHEDDNEDEDDDEDKDTETKNKNKSKSDTPKRVKASELRGVSIRSRMRIRAKGTDVPDPIEQFKELDSRFKIRRYLAKNIAAMKYSSPSPIQMQAIPTMMSDREVIACAPTGSGKTAAFTIPILHALNRPQKEGFRAVIISPTRELAQQIYRQFRLLSKGKPFRICVLSKSLQSHSSSVSYSQNFDILITTPLRLVNLIQERTISLNKVEHLVFDEADRLFDQQFVEQVDDVVAACQNAKLKISLFSATMNIVVEEMARSIMKNPIKIVIGEENSASTNVDQKLIFVGKEEGKLLAFRQLIQKGLEPPVLIFVQSKERAQELFQELIFDNINVDVIHSDRTQFQRDKIVEKFRSGQIWVLICTDLMARGMDFKGVNFVVNFDFPKNIASYVHRIGRTGRAGRTGVAYTFYTEADAPMIPTISNVMRNSGSEVPDWMKTVHVRGVHYDRKPAAATEVATDGNTEVNGDSTAVVSSTGNGKLPHIKYNNNNNKYSNNNNNNNNKNKKKGLTSNGSTKNKSDNNKRKWN
ncbi:hypothetical protein SAMD00019534_029730, partial [Acytostelium subglobosum LB1]|uniref:hypothetical protein n=1 Tax=Acytostelium subglobosum LB1 TaxID=1410327 RepID=UPI000644CB0B